MPDILCSQFVLHIGHFMNNELADMYNTLKWLLSTLDGCRCQEAYHQGDVLMSQVNKAPTLNTVGFRFLLGV